MIFCWFAYRILRHNDVISSWALTNYRAEKAENCKHPPIVGNVQKFFPSTYQE